MLDWQAIFYSLVGIAFLVGGYLYRELKAKVDKTHEDSLTFKTYVAEHYVSNNKLAEAVSNLNRNVESVAAGVLRIETRINSQFDNRNGNQ